MNRRSFLRLAPSVAVTLRSPAIAKANPAGELRRPFGWRDAESRSEVERLAVSDDGTCFALQVTRPFSADGRFFGEALPKLLDLRGELWLLHDSLENAQRLHLGSRGVWSPCFSPDARRLSALTLVGPGKVGVAVWELKTGKAKIFSDLNLDIMFSSFRDAQSAYSPAASSLMAARQYLWLNARAMLFIDYGTAPQQFALGGTSLTWTLGAFRKRTEVGRPSVRVWGRGAGVCGSESRLVQLNIETGEMQTLYSGAVRGASLSPDGRRLALLVATKSIAPPPNRPVTTPLGYSGSDEALVELKLTIIEVDLPQRANDIKGVTGVGDVPPSRLPVWSEGSTRVAVPVRTSYSSVPSTPDDAAWEVNLHTHEARRLQATSALDAELLAALIATEGLNTQDVIARRPKSIVPADYVNAGVEGGAWRCGLDQVMFWQSPSLALISRSRTTTIPGDFSSVLPTVVSGSTARTLAVRVGGKSSVVTTSIAGHHIDDLPAAPGWTLLGVVPGDGRAIFKEDADSGTYIVQVTPRTPPKRLALAFNTYFRNIRKPDCRVLKHRFPDGSARYGVLQLPVDDNSKTQHPVIIYAYPRFEPSTYGPLTRPNSYASLIYPVQYLLAKGFAFFHAPFPISGGSLKGPMEAAADAVEPWLDVLGRQADIIPGEYGFWGHSNAGYVGLALEALTHRFKAIVAWDTFPEIGYDTLHSDSDDVALNCAGNAIQENRFYYEDPRLPYAGQAGPLWFNPLRQIENSPVFRLKDASTPLLLVEGEFDGDPREMEEVYSILYGQGVPVELAYYWGEGHVFGSPGNVRDSWLRTEAFFRKYLIVR